MALQLLRDAIVVDLSHWQPPGSIDWKTAKAEGNVVGAIIKLMQNGAPDPAHVQHLYDAYEAGIRLLGIYDFGVEDPDHVTFLNEALGEFQGRLDRVLLALDAEQSSNQMSVATAAVWVQAIDSNQHRYPTLYMGKAGPDGTGRMLPNAALSKCDLWLPKYGPEPTVDSLPPGFRLPTSDTDRGGVLRLWQFTGDGINPPAVWPKGIPPKCDLSYPVGFSSIEALTAWWGT